MVAREEIIAVVAENTVRVNIVNEEDPTAGSIRPSRGWFTRHASSKQPGFIRAKLKGDGRKNNKAQGTRGGGQRAVI